MTHAAPILSPRLQAAETLARATAAPYDDQEGALQQSVVDRLRERLSRSGKVCTTCDTAKALSAFGPSLSAHDGLDTRCRAFEAQRRRMRRASSLVPSEADSPPSAAVPDRPGALHSVTVA
jgi:hypothetical protein